MTYFLVLGGNSLSLRSQMHSNNNNNLACIMPVYQTIQRRWRKDKASWWFLQVEVST